MISVILYGRNDAHGYNLHKRAAISLNCISEVLTHPDDEIIFVDYNTPDDLPTFIEAIYDTLTPRAASLLRVFRLRPAMHAACLGSRTHLLALEPHSRNIGIRRSNASNKWILFTNTDMIFVPRSGIESLSGAVADLQDGQYILPRFELPEPLWEGFPRCDPQRIIRECDDLGSRLHLNEIAITHPYMRFDSPGDFQLAPRKTMFDIRGFDERMIHGWHADSNLCKRLYLWYGQRTESLAHRLKGYHCDHTRVATLAHRLDIKLENDLQQFVYGVEDPCALQPDDSWGMPDVDIEEIDFGDGPQARFVRAVEAAVGPPQEAEYYSNAIDLRNFVHYVPEHVLPYLASNLTIYPKTARFLYVGVNPSMLRLAGKCVCKMGFPTLSYLASLMPEFPLTDYLTPCRLSDGAHAAADLSVYDLIFVDFGLDGHAPGAARNARRVTEWPRELRHRLGTVADQLARFAEIPGDFGQPSVLVLNGNHHLFSEFVSHFLVAADTPYNTHVRKGRFRKPSERLYFSNRWKCTEERMRSFFGYGLPDAGVPTLGPGQVIDFTSCGDSGRFKDGHWGEMDVMGTWTDGPYAEILFRPSAEVQSDIVAYFRVVEAFLGFEEEPIRINAWFNGELIGRWNAVARYATANYRAVLPFRLFRAAEISNLRLVIENPQSTHAVATLKGQQVIGEDPRELGVKIQRLTLSGLGELEYRIGNTIEFIDGRSSAVHLNECWTQPDNLGAWTLGEDARLVLYLTDTPDLAAIATFTITDVAVTEQYPLLDVSVAFNGHTLAEWSLGPSRMKVEQKVLVPAEVLRAATPLEISIHVGQPRTPILLGWSQTDDRRLGFRLTRFRMDPVGVPRYKLGEVIDFTAQGRGAGYLDLQWTAPDRYGAWTLGPESRMFVNFEAPPPSSVDAAFVVSDCMVSNAEPAMPVRVKANNEVVDEWVLGPDRTPHVRSLKIPATAIAHRSHLTLTFEVPDPRSPVALGWSADSRPLGLRLARAVLGQERIEVPNFSLATESMESIRGRIRRAFRGLLAARMEVA
jgi:hypothetical protein